MAAESFYTQMFTGVNVPLPSSYPSHTLVGCVDIVSVLSQDEYRSLVLDATSPLENHAPWLWQCENPHMCVTWPVVAASAGCYLVAGWLLTLMAATWVSRCSLDPSAGFNLKRTFEMDTSQLVHLPAAFVRGAEKNVAPVSVAWRPVQPLVRSARVSLMPGAQASH